MSSHFSMQLIHCQRSRLNHSGSIRFRSSFQVDKFVNLFLSLIVFNLYQMHFKVPDNSTLGRHYALDQQHLPHIITSIESKLGNPTTDNAILHLIVYVPPCSGAPLHIYDAQRRRSSLTGVDSFLSPKWGGIVVANPDESVCEEALRTRSKVDVHVHSGRTMQVMLYLLRKLVDVQNEVSLNIIKYSSRCRQTKLQKKKHIHTQ